MARDLQKASVEGQTPVAAVAAVAASQLPRWVELAGLAW